MRSRVRLPSAPQNPKETGEKEKHLTVWLSAFFVGTEDRDRTGTSVTSLVFETNASTYSATSAQIGGKNTLFSDMATCQGNIFFTLQIKALI